MTEDGVRQRRVDANGDVADGDQPSESFDHLTKIYSECVVEEAPDWDSCLERAKGDFGKSMFRRLLHWGPIIAILITVSIGVSATYLHLQWWPLRSVGAYVDLLLFLVLNYSVLSNLCQSAFIGPGYLPVSWTPPSKEGESHLQLCAVCDGYKVPRSHHCSRCGRCVMKMDHHCPWINNCVGHRNHAYFVRFLAAAVAGCVHAAVIISCAIYRGLFGHGGLDGPNVMLTIYSFIASVFAFGLALGVIVAVGFLLVVQLRGIYRNRTGIEDYIVDKANSYERSDAFLYPYDLGWRRNVREVLGTWGGLPTANGVWWPIRRPTTQFTFSEEQLQQKRIKRLNAREVVIVHKFEGTCLASLLAGVRVFFCQPCSEEPRVPVEVGEHWMVTRVNRHWFYGTKKEPEDLQSEEESDPAERSRRNRRRPPRGWFPRTYAEKVQQAD